MPKFDSNAWMLPDFSLKQTVKIAEKKLISRHSPDEI